MTPNIQKDFPSKEIVSVVIPIYGNFSIDRILICIESIKNQESIEVEIIVSEQGENRRLPIIDGIKHIFTYHKPEGDIKDFNPGQIRNMAILHSTGEYIYTIDADVILQDSLFLKKSLDFLRLNPQYVLYRPFMRRLPKEDFDVFKKWFNEFGIKEAMRRMIINQEFLVKTDEKYRELKVFEKLSKEAGYQKTFTAFIEEYKQYVNERLGGDNEFNFWPLYWLENRHCGSNLFRRKHFFEVGGYSEDFINWGCEDSDLQWKFREKYQLVFFPENLEVVHLDHDRSYISPKMWNNNESKCTLRKTEGVDKTISHDKKYLENKYL